jgi:hypothetical protein
MYIPRRLNACLMMMRVYVRGSSSVSIAHLKRLLGRALGKIRVAFVVGDEQGESIHGQLRLEVRDGAKASGVLMMKRALPLVLAPRTGWITCWSAYLNCYLLVSGECVPKGWCCVNEAM